MKTSSKDNKSERVNVYVRMRPFTEDEMKKDSSTPVETFDTINNVIVGKHSIYLYKKVKKDYDKKTFSFDSCLQPNISQKEVFDKTSKGVVDVSFIFTKQSLS